MVRLAVGIIVFNGMPWIEGQLETWYPYADQIIITEGPIKFWQDRGYSHSVDGTVETILAFRDPERKITLIQGQWEEKEEMCNTYMGKVRGATHVWHVDVDEFYAVETIEHTLGVLDQYDVVGFQRLTFIGDFWHFLDVPKQSIPRIYRHYEGARYYTHRPLSVLDPQTGQRWHLAGRYLYHQPLIYHYSLVLPSQREEKAAYYGGRSMMPRDLPILEWQWPHPQWIEENREQIWKQYAFGNS